MRPEPILAYARPTSGTNVVRILTVDNNTITENASIFTASFYLADFRNVGGTNSFSGNSFTLSGTLPGGTDAIREIAIRGSQTGTWNIKKNNLQGGGVTHNNSPTVFVSGIAVMSNDATTGGLPSTAVINVANNFISGFEDGIVVRDGVTPAYGNLPAGVTLSISNNDLSGNSLFSLAPGNGGTNTDASANWWGATLATVSTKIAGTAVDYTPYLGASTDIGGNPADGFQGDFSNLVVHTSGQQVGTTGRFRKRSTWPHREARSIFWAAPTARSAARKTSTRRAKPFRYHQAQARGEGCRQRSLPKFGSTDTVPIELNGTDPAFIRQFRREWNGDAGECRR